MSPTSSAVVRWLSTSLCPKIASSASATWPFIAWTLTAHLVPRVLQRCPTRSIPALRQSTLPALLFTRRPSHLCTGLIHRLRHRCTPLASSLGHAQLHGLLRPRSRGHTQSTLTRSPHTRSPHTPNQRTRCRRTPSPWSLGLLRNMLRLQHPAPAAGLCTQLLWRSGPPQRLLRPRPSSLAAGKLTALQSMFGPPSKSASLRLLALARLMKSRPGRPQIQSTLGLPRSKCLLGPPPRKFLTGLPPTARSPPRPLLGQP